jgi:hypothetical protein
LQWVGFVKGWLVLANPYFCAAKLIRMRYMKWTGLLTVILLIVSCFSPWVFIASKNIIISGTDANPIDLGKPGYLHFVFAFFFTIFHFTPRVWAKRWNLLITGLNMAWAVRNFFIISACRTGECPEKQTGIYLMFIASLLLLVSALFPDVELNEKN